MIPKFPILLTLLIAAPAMPQALKNHNSNAPVDFEADRIEVQDKSSRAMLSGNVNVRQGELSLTAARMTVAYTGAITNGNPSISRLDASGGVFVRSPTETAQGDFATGRRQRQRDAESGHARAQHHNLFSHRRFPRYLLQVTQWRLPGSRQGRR